VLICREGEFTFVPGFVDVSKCQPDDRLVLCVHRRLAQIVQQTEGLGGIITVRECEGRLHLGQLRCGPVTALLRHASCLGIRAAGLLVHAQPGVGVGHEERRLQLLISLGKLPCLQERRCGCAKAIEGFRVALGRPAPTCWIDCAEVSAVDAETLVTRRIEDEKNRGIVLAMICR
jgi:hypothetical protein